MAIHRRAVIGFGLAGASLAALAPAARAQPRVTLQGAPSAAVQDAVADIRAYAARHLDAYGLPGMTVAVVAPAGVTASFQLGRNDETGAPIGPEQLVEIGSISKSMTALCVFQLIDEGKLGLGDDARRLLPDAPWPAGAPITVQHLLNHSSGLPDDAPLFPLAPTRLWRGYEPGTQWSYSNLGYRLLGLIVERLRGEPLKQVIETRILGPLGMRGSRGAILSGERALYVGGHAPLYDDRWPGLKPQLTAAAWTEMTEGSGCVASTAADMALYARWLIAAGQGRGAPLLSDAGARRFTTRTIEAPGWGIPGAGYANGLAVIEVGGHQVLQHTGGMLSFNSCLHVDPVSGVGAFASTNVGMIGYRPRDVTGYAITRLRAALEQRPTPVPPPAPPEPPPTAPFVGRYLAADGEALEVARDGAGLVVAPAAGPAIPVEPAGETVLAARDPSRTPFAFVFDREHDALVRVWWGGKAFARGGLARPQTEVAPTPPQLLALTGHYASDDPWVGHVRVTARGSRLYVNDGTPLTPLDANLFRAGDDDWSPERVVFDSFVDGRPMRLIASGAELLRRSV